MNLNCLISAVIYAIIFALVVQFRLEQNLAKQLPKAEHHAIFCALHLGLKDITCFATCKVGF